MNTKVVTGILSAVLVLYFVLLGGRAVALFRDGRPIAVAFGAGIMLLPVVGAWILWSTLRFGLRTHALSTRLAAEGGLPDTSHLPRRPSGRLEQAAADELFDQRKAELEENPDDWRRWYRLAQAYDLAGDRPRARVAMKEALAKEQDERTTKSGPEKDKG